MSGVLILKPIGGMGNRLYAMASARTYARKTHKQLKVLWNQRWELNAKFTDFWEPNGFDLTYTDEYNLPWRWFNKPMIREKWLLFGADRISDSDMYHIRDEIGGYDFQEYLRRHNHSPKLFIETCFNFYPARKEKLKDIFIPVKAIQNELDEWGITHGTGLVGMHIRRTDHGNSLSSSPDSLFENILNNEEKDSKILLCTDDPETEIKFRKEFGERIITYSRNKSRDTADGIRNAVMDILLLSRCSRIYGSFKSTFSSFAAEYGEIPLIVVSNN